MEIVNVCYRLKTGHADYGKNNEKTNDDIGASQGRGSRENPYLLRTKN